MDFTLISLSTQWGPKAHTLFFCLLSGGPSAHTFFWVISQRPAPYFTVHSVGCLQPTPSSEWFLQHLHKVKVVSPCEVWAQMTKKRSRLTCDNMEELVYLHEVWDLGLVKKMLLDWWFFESMKHITFNVFSCLLIVDYETPSEWLWLWLSPVVSRLSFSFSIHTHTHTHIVTVIV